MKKCLIRNCVELSELSLMQGDTYRLPIKIMHKGYVIKDIDVKKIEFQFGNISKSYPGSDVTYFNERFIVRFTQSETLSMNSNLYNECQASVLFNDNSRKSTELYSFEVFKTLIRKEI